MEAMGNDRWKGSFQVQEIGLTEYTIEAWGDAFESWLEEVEEKIDGGSTDFSVEVLEGAVLVRLAMERSLIHQGGSQKYQSPSDLEKLESYALRLEKGTDLSLQELNAIIADEPLLSIMRQWPDRSFSTCYEPSLTVRVDRLRANFAAWYEFFPRSAKGSATHASTFRDCLARIDDAKAMGLDVIYFPPIHPIGITGRKGRNNSLICLPDDPGVPYAIGGAAGGHCEIEPTLGTLADFEWLLKEIKERGMELALDFALNCSPDHPYVTNHPEWFFHRPDGSIKYAENPPKKYEDVFPLNFNIDSWQELWNELRDVLMTWAERGVRIFRIDNPHTKPVAFWQWVIAQVQKKYPDTIFLSEAFTRSPMMKVLAKVGFTQSYTYFSWRNTKQELEEYFTELTQTEMKNYFRPHLFPNTPDILPYYLQEGGRPAFLIRAVLASTLSSLYGIYSGFELCENTPVLGREDYADSEKYQLKERDWNAPGNIKAWITRLNQIRKTYSALQTTNNLQFCFCNNASIIFYLKRSENNRDHLLIAVNLDPFHAQSGVVEVPLHELGLSYDASYRIEDLLSGESYYWKGASNFISLNPQTHPAHIFKIS